MWSFHTVPLQRSVLFILSSEGDCPCDQVATLNKATAYIFTDMQTAERHGHAGECYETTAKRCGALLQWINMVIQSLS